jgi:hypothetical protein
MYKDAYECGSLGINVNRGVIKSLPKRGFVKNWSPITFQNLSYKIIAKVIARRIADIIKNFVLVTQIGFIKGRYILENLITISEAMYWAKSKEKNVAMVLLDFEKAYDRVELSFIIGILKDFGFLPYLFKWIKILFQDSSILLI